MKVFTYNDYIKSIHTLRLNEVLQLAEERAEYKLEKSSNINKEIGDKIIESILNKKEEAIKFINDFLKIGEKVDKNNLLICDKSYIMRKYKTNEAKQIFKIKNKEIFILIVHQKNKDNMVEYRVLNYCVDIIYESTKRKVNKEKIFPLVIPVIIYTGKEKWKNTKKSVKRSENNYLLNMYKVTIDYNLIDINKFSINYLMQKHSLFGYAMVIEKSNNKDELKGNIDLIINDIKDKEHFKYLLNIIEYIIQD